MSVFHFRGEFIAQQDGCARYRFQTDYVDDPKRIGVFTVNTRTWTWSVDEPADPRHYPDGTSRDSHCAAALTHKIRKAFDLEGLPAVVFHIA